MFCYVFYEVDSSVMAPSGQSAWRPFDGRSSEDANYITPVLAQIADARGLCNATFAEPA